MDQVTQLHSANGQGTGPDVSPPTTPPSLETGYQPGPADVSSSTAALKPLPHLQPRRKIDLSTAALPEPGSMAAVETLAVKELKGVGQTFTANVGAMLSFHGLVYRPQNEYETVYQILAAPLINDPRVMSRATRIAFVPAFSWSTFEMVVVPFKLTTFGRKVLDDLVKLEPAFPRRKSFTQWEPTKRRHIVYFEDLSAQELGIITEVCWPTKEHLLEALQATAFDNLEDLLAANEEIRALVHAKEVK